MKEVNVLRNEINIREIAEKLMSLADYDVKLAKTCGTYNDDTIIVFNDVKTHIIRFFCVNHTINAIAMEIITSECANVNEETANKNNIDLDSFILNMAKNKNLFTRTVANGINQVLFFSNPFVEITDLFNDVIS